MNRTTKILLAILLLVGLSVYSVSQFRQDKDIDTGKTPNNDYEIQELSLETVGEAVDYSDPFGIAYPTSARNADKNITDLGADSVRIIAHWFQFERVRGKYEFEYVADAIRKFGSNNDQTLLITLRPVSDWGYDIVPANVDKYAFGASHGKVTELEAWGEAVTKLVEKFDNDGEDDYSEQALRVKYWQLDNEWTSQWTGTRQEYMEYMKTTSNAIRKADPTAIIISPAIAGTPTFAFADGYIKDRDAIQTSAEDQVSRADLQARGGESDTGKKLEDVFAKGNQYFDVIAIHTYGSDPYVLPGTFEWVNAMKKKYSINKPIWQTETAFPRGEDISASEHAKMLIPQHVLSIFSASQKVFLFSYTFLRNAPENDQHLNLVDRQGNKRPAYYTYKTMTSVMSDYESISQLKSEEPIYAYRLNSTNGSALVLWARSGTHKVSFSSDKEVEVIVPPVERGQTQAKVRKIKPLNGSIALEVSDTPKFVVFQK